jgi:hypothetical protein
VEVRLARAQIGRSAAVISCGVCMCQVAHATPDVWRTALHMLLLTQKQDRTESARPRAHTNVCSAVRAWSILPCQQPPPRLACWLVPPSGRVLPLLNDSVMGYKESLPLR